MIDTPIFCKALKFAAHAAGKKDIRYYLNGVFMDVAGNTLTLCATDGARMAVCSMRLDPTTPADAGIIVSNDDAKRVLSAIGKDKGQVTLEIAAPTRNGAPKLTISAGGASLQVDGIDGKYPEYRRAIPSAGRGQGGMPVLQASLLAEACAAMAPLAGEYKGLRPLNFDSTGQPGDSIVIRPARAPEHCITDLLVVIQAVRI